jgi:8-oxo-dGTP pyrophosphatase MutT (NUDIX family)
VERRLLFLNGGHRMTLAHQIRRALEHGMQQDIDVISQDSNVGSSVEDVVDAAVLIAITNRAEPGIILTQRPETMRKHPGQVAFPGGRMDADDHDIIAAALREAHEEIGLSPAVVELVGLADLYYTITSYVVTPVIGVIPADLPLVANQEEVDSIFEVPLSFLLNTDNHKVQKVDWEGKERCYYEMHWEDRRIWGATAAMIVNLSRRLPWPL